MSHENDRTDQLAGRKVVSTPMQEYQEGVDSQPYGGPAVDYVKELLGAGGPGQLSLFDVLAKMGPDKQSVIAKLLQQSGMFGQPERKGDPWAPKGQVLASATWEDKRPPKNQVEA